MELRLILIALLTLGILSCGKKAPPHPPIFEKKEHAPSGKSGGLIIGTGGYLSSGNRIALYWSFPVSVDYSIVYLNGRITAKTKDFSFIYGGKVKKGTTFKVVGFKNGKPVAVVYIKITH